MFKQYYITVNPRNKQAEHPADTPNLQTITTANLVQLLFELR